MIAVRDKLMDVSSEEVSNQGGRLSRSMTIKAYNEIETDLLDHQCVTLHVPVTLETKEQL